MSSSWEPAPRVCVVAARLSEQQDARVLLLEAGSATPPPDGAVSAVVAHSFGRRMELGGRRRTIQSATGTRDSGSPAGPRSSGGQRPSTPMIFARGHRASYAAWEDAGAKGLELRCVVALFQANRERLFGRDPRAARLLTGPLIVRAADPTERTACRRSGRRGPVRVPPCQRISAAASRWASGPST